MVARLRTSTRRPTHFNRDSASGHRGFSLLELLIVISIILIAMGFALPSILSTLQYRTLQNTLLSSAGAIQKARFQALSTGVPYGITFSSSASTYQVLQCSNCAGTIYDPNLTYTFAAAPSPIGTPVPFAATGGPTLAASQTIYFRPGGAVQATWGTTNCLTPISMTFSYRGVSKTLTAGCYGNVTVPQ
jgi:prepilin-type N-terminal cleavage/methylation domain-containing protein